MDECSVASVVRKTCNPWSERHGEDGGGKCSTDAVGSVAVSGWSTASTEGVTPAY